MTLRGGKPDRNQSACGANSTNTASFRSYKLRASPGYGHLDAQLAVSL
jgi:hypothetical protein